MDRDTLLLKLTALDFLAVDLGLYLDTHPTDANAIAEYNKIIETASAVREKYEQMYGPLCSFRSYNGNPSRFIWVNQPWPWQEDFNFAITEGGN